MSRQHTIELVFHSHPWATHQLEQTGLLLPQYRTLLVEAECESQLRLLARQIPNRSPGPVALLRQPRSLAIERISRRLPRIPAPLVLAPIPAVSPSTLLASLMVLDTVELEYDRVLLLASVANAEQLVPLYGMVDRFHILWDVADYPSRALTECTALLRDHADLDNARWGGIKLCNHDFRSSEEHEENLERFQEAILEAGV